MRAGAQRPQMRSAADELIGAAVFLASRGADFITGVTLLVDGVIRFADAYQISRFDREDS
jgi:hypothetical protein